MIAFLLMYMLLVVLQKPLHMMVLLASLSESRVPSIL